LDAPWTGNYRTSSAIEELNVKTNGSIRKVFDVTSASAANQEDDNARASQILCCTPWRKLSTVFSHNRN
jgi:hypothetical protein